MGAAGLTSSSVEMAGKGGLGIELDLDRVPVRESGMTPYEIMLSESQERMLMILRPASEAEARYIFEKWELDFAVIGRVTDTGRLVLRSGEEIAADIPVGPLVTEAPVYRRPWRRPDPEPEIDPASLPDRDPLECLQRLLASPALASKRWIWEQYDHLVMGNTVKRPGGDAAVVRVSRRWGKALALATDCTPRYCRADPVRGGAQAVAESWRNLTAVGAEPLAITDNMNFGNPERPEIMGQFVGAIEGMREACLALDYPVVSGNVSLYNETSGRAILPTPVIGGVGLIADAGTAVDLALKRDGDAVILIGDTSGHLGASLVSARDRRPRGGPAAACRSRRRTPQRRFRPRHDTRRICRRLSRSVGWRASRRARRDGDGGSARLGARSPPDRIAASRLPVWRRPGALLDRSGGCARRCWRLRRRRGFRPASSAWSAGLR